ncbi:MAG: D-alanyl-D-alanine carboxypeptidase family protein [Alphaproteobacteria bacterium]
MGVSDQLNSKAGSSSLLDKVMRASLNFALSTVLLAGSALGQADVHNDENGNVFLSGKDAIAHKDLFEKEGVFRTDYPLASGAYSAFKCYKNSSPNIDIETYFVMDADTGDILLDHGGHLKIQPASMTKLMTALLVHEAIEDGFDPNTLLYVSEVQADARDYDDKILFKPNIREKLGTYIRAFDADQAALIGSYNDAAFLLAENVAKFRGIGNSETAFVGLMNTKAEEIGMENTVFYNSNGMPLSHAVVSGEGLGSTTGDFVTLLREIDTKHDDLMDIMGMTAANLRLGKGRKDITSSNSLVKRVDLLPFDEVAGKSGATCNTGLAATMRFDQGDKSIYISYVGGRSWYDREQRMTQIAERAFEKIDENRARLEAYAESELHDQTILSCPECADFDLH